MIYDANHQLDGLIKLTKLGSVRMRRQSYAEVITRLTDWIEQPLTDENLQAWFQKGWDHYLFDLPYGAVAAANDFRRVTRPQPPEDPSWAIRDANLPLV